MKKVFWFSRHEMTDEQFSDLRRIFNQEVAFENLNKTISSISQIEAEIERNDILCVVMPLELQSELFRRIEGTGKRLLVPVSHRVPYGNNEYAFVHAGWKEVKELTIRTETLTWYPAPNGAAR